MPDDVQPDAGQGTEAPGSPYDSYLETVPEQAKEAAETWFRDTSKGLDAKLQEAAELKKTWEPYKQVEALSQYPPEQLSELLAWHQQVSASDDAFQQWLTQAAQDAGFTKAEAQALEDGQSDGVLSKEAIEQLVAERAAEQVQPLEAKVTQWEEQQVFDQAAEEFRTDLTRLEKEHGEFSDDMLKAIIDLGKDYEGEGSWVQAGYERIQQISSGAEQALFAGKSGQPAPTLAAGGQAAFQPPKTFKEASDQFRERLRQSAS